jgi:hypothetical protein
VGALMPPPPRIHNLPHNSSERVPGRCLFFDTETRPRWDGGEERHTLRLWHAELVERRGPSRKRPRADTWSGHTAAQLGAAVADACRPKETLWCWAHNLGFDLAVTQLPLVLAEQGWEISTHALTGPSPWIRLRRAGRTLTMVDSASWLPVALERLGGMVATPKPPLPEWDDSDAAWFARCRADVAILRAAVLELLAWWEANRLGHVSLTGPGSGFNAYRHSRLHTTVVINPDPELRALERGVIYGGRAEAMRVGELGAGHWVCVDFEHAFGSICAELPLPRKHARRFDSLDDTSLSLTSPWVSLLAQVEVDTSRARYPLRTAKGVVHPVGRFVTTLCGPEIREAHRRGELRAIGPGLMYFTAPHMRSWAQWALEIVDARDPDQSEVVRVAVKAWTRTVPGRWAGRTGRVSAEVEQPLPGWRLERTHTRDGRTAVSILDMAGSRYYVVQDQEMDQGFPAVLAWIQSEVRVRLGRLIDLIGEPAVVLANTDGVIVDLDAFSELHDPGLSRLVGPQGRLEALSARLDGWASRCWPLRPTVKWVARTLEVLSPQHVITDRARQLSGVPASAEHLGGHRYAFTDWPKLPTQLQGDVENGYVRRRRTVDLSAVPVLRWVLADGSCVPVEARGRLGEGSALCPWRNGENGAAGPALRADQHPLLAGLR